MAERIIATEGADCKQQASVNSLMTTGTEQKAFKELVSIAGRSPKHARGLPDQVDITPHWSGIGFQIFGQRFVAPLGEVVESIEVPSFTKTPGVKTWLKGISNVRGRLLPITDLAMFFNQNLAGVRKRRRVLIIEYGDTYCGLMVEHVYGMQHFPVDTYSKTIPGVDDDVKPYLKGSYVQGDIMWTIFSPHALVKSEKFLRAEMTA